MRAVWKSKTGTNIVRDVLMIYISYQPHALGPRGLVVVLQLNFMAYVKMFRFHFFFVFLFIPNKNKCCLIIYIIYPRVVSFSPEFVP